MMGSKSVLYNWQKFIDDQPIKEISADDGELLLEMDQKIIDQLRDEIAKSESGTYDGMPFNDIFGEPSEDSPKTRMIMPYGNPDIHKMKILMLDMFDIVFREYNSNPNIKFVSGVVWSNKKETVTQKLKPLKWKEGDPVKEVSKEVGSPIMTVIYVSKLGENKERRIEVPFGKLLQKHFPKEMPWWQGNKAKDIAGKQSFFTGNVETMDNIIHEVIYGDEDAIRNEPATEKVVIVSRHPIDVVRMSNFDLIHSCHSPDASNNSFFHCAIEEAKRTAGGGAVLYLLDKARFDEKFKDGVMPQTGDVFNDRDRGIDDKLDVQPTSRLRLRKVVDAETGVEYAVPDRKLYGSNSPEAFRKETFAYFANRQLDKFIDPETGKPIIPNTDSLERYGGNYEDPSGDRVGPNFVGLMGTAFKQSNMMETVLADEKWLELKTNLEANSIAWQGDLDEERLNVNEDDCEEELGKYRSIIEDAKRRLSYIDVEHPDYDCQYGSVILESDINALVLVRFPKSVFINPDPIADINRVLEQTDFDSNGIAYPDMTLHFFDTILNRDIVVITCGYSGLPDGPRQLARWMEDLIAFEQKLSYEDYVAEVEDILMNAGVIGHPDSAIRDILNQLEDKIEDSQFELMDGSTRRKKIYGYTFNIMTIPYSESEQSKVTGFSKSSASEDFVDLFLDIFNQKTVRDLQNSLRQQPLFNGESFDLSAIRTPKETYSISLAITDESKPYTSQKEFIATATFNITVDTSKEEGEIVGSIALLNKIIQNPSIVENLAHKAFVQVYKQYLTERKNTRSNKLIKEWRIKISK